MIKHLLKHEYPNLKGAEYRKALSFIDGKCNQYYFLDYMRCTNGNVDDAIEFYLLDDKLRSLFTQYLIRFEIQIKTDFVDSVQTSTHCSSFWNKRKYYLPDARNSRVRNKASKFHLMKKKIQFNISRLTFSTIGPSNYVAMYSSSFGTFQELFKLIDVRYKVDFINKYTSHLTIHGYKILSIYLEAIRRIRNRCAHGNHIITLKMVNDLNNLKQRMFALNASPKPEVYLTTMEAITIFLVKQLNCGLEFKNKIISVLNKHQDILIKYNGKHCLSANTNDKID